MIKLRGDVRKKYEFLFERYHYGTRVFPSQEEWHDIEWAAKTYSAYLCALEERSPEEGGALNVVRTDHAEDERLVAAGGSDVPTELDATQAYELLTFYNKEFNREAPGHRMSEAPGGDRNKIDEYLNVFRIGPAGELIFRAFDPRSRGHDVPAPDKITDVKRTKDVLSGGDSVYRTWDQPSELADPEEYALRKNWGSKGQWHPRRYYVLSTQLINALKRLGIDVGPNDPFVEQLMSLNSKLEHSERFGVDVIGKKLDPSASRTQGQDYLARIEGRYYIVNGNTNHLRATDPMDLIGFDEVQFATVRGSDLILGRLGKSIYEIDVEINPGIWMHLRPGQRHNHGSL